MIGGPVGHGPGQADCRDGSLRQARESPSSFQPSFAPPDCHVAVAVILQLEYDNIEGMILLSELSRRRIRSVQKLIRVGRNEVVVVMRVDPDKGKLSPKS